MNKTTKDVQRQNSDFSPLSFSVGLDNNFLDLLSFEAIVVYQQTTNDFEFGWLFLYFEYLAISLALHAHASKVIY